jgi:hypothetical protein
MNLIFWLYEISWYNWFEYVLISCDHVRGEWLRTFSFIMLFLLYLYCRYAVYVASFILLFAFDIVQPIPLLTVFYVGMIDLSLALFCARYHFAYSRV